MQCSATSTSSAMACQKGVASQMTWRWNLSAKDIFVNLRRPQNALELEPNVTQVDVQCFPARQVVSDREE
jgi:hypothetical protein